MLTLVRHRGRSHWGSLSARSGGGLVIQGGGNFDSQMANKILTWDQLMIKLVHKRLFLFQWNNQNFDQTSIQWSQTSMSKKLAQKNKFHHESNLKLYSFPWGNLWEAVLLRGNSDWWPNMIYSPIFATTLLFSHSRSSLLQSHSLLLPVWCPILYANIHHKK